MVVNHELPSFLCMDTSGGVHIENAIRTLKPTDQPLDQYGV